MGLPRGSILGPLLFTIYTNNLSSSVEDSNYHMFVNDTYSIFYSLFSSDAKEAFHRINYNLENLAPAFSKHTLYKFIENLCHALL